uniref:Uncharacterized protein n=1 Tax=Arundo donax TaxID=35708 RepID=A0A0A9GZ74_ARUDO
MVHSCVVLINHYRNGIPFHRYSCLSLEMWRPNNGAQPRPFGMCDMACDVHIPQKNNQDRNLNSL